MMYYKELFDLAERAKIYKLFEITNIIFVFLLGEAFRNKRNFTFSLQTSDLSGKVFHDAYYDLVCIRYQNSSHTLSLKVPITLLDPVAWSNLIKRGFHVERLKPEKRREEKHATQEIQRELWGKLLDFANNDHLEFAIQLFVNRDSEGGRFDQKKGLRSSLNAWKSSLKR